MRGSALVTPPPIAGATVAAARRPPRVAFLLSDLNGGGVQRMVTILAGALAERGARVDLVVCDAGGKLRSQLPGRVHVVALDRGHPVAARLAALRAGAWSGLPVLARSVLLALRHTSKTLPCLRSLVAYLREARPVALFTAMPQLNVEAVLARRLAGTPTRLVVSERTHFSGGKPRKVWRSRHLAAAMRWAYTQADAIVAVSNGVADDLAAATGIPREAITTLHNPTITPDFWTKLEEPADHPWFGDGGGGAPPVVLGVGRVGHQKDFLTLLRAFARVRRERPARLVIIGDVRPHKSAERLEAFYGLATELGVRADVDLIGYRPNPLPYMARAAVFALSSRFEGFPNVLLEALACGTPVVSTDCPSGPAEILDGGTYGRLVPVGDDAALAAAIAATLDDPPDPARLRARAALFSYEAAVGGYEAILLGGSALPVPGGEGRRGH